MKTVGKYNNHSLQESWAAPSSFSPSSPSFLSSSSCPCPSSALCLLQQPWAGRAHAPGPPSGGSARRRGDPRWTGPRRSWNSRCPPSHPGYKGGGGGRGGGSLQHLQKGPDEGRRYDGWMGGWTKRQPETKLNAESNDIFLFIVLTVLITINQENNWEINQY